MRSSKGKWISAIIVVFMFGSNSQLYAGYPDYSGDLEFSGSSPVTTVLLIGAVTCGVIALIMTIAKNRKKNADTTEPTSATSSISMILDDLKDTVDPKRDGTSPISFFSTFK